MNVLIPPNIKWLSREDYEDILKSGMFWEYYPSATGNYYDDVGGKMEIDIRNTMASEPIDTIRFGDSCFDCIYKDGMSIYIAKEDDGEVNIEDIDHLILALRKAKELWS